MRLIYFSRDYSTHDHRFLSALAATEHQVYYLRLEKQNHTLEDRPLPGVIEVVDWAGGKGPANLSGGPGLLSSLKEVIHKINPDLIQAGPLQTSAYLATLSGFKPIVATSWGSDILVEADRSPWMRQVTRYVLQRSAVLVGDCDAVRQKAMSFNFPEERIITFPWGIDLERYAPKPKRGNEAGVFVLLSTRSWEPIYGIDVIVKAFIQTWEQLKKSSSKHLLSPRLIMLGDGSQSEIIRNMVAAADLEGKVTFAGRVSQEELAGYYQQADLYVAASHSDGTSISLLEAMACGLPVLVSDIPGNREWVMPGIQGWLFPDGDSDALSRGMINAIDQRENLPGMGAAGRHLAEERADWKQNFQQLLRAYELALKVEASG